MKYYDGKKFIAKDHNPYTSVPSHCFLIPGNRAGWMVAGLGYKPALSGCSRAGLFGYGFWDADDRNNASHIGFRGITWETFRGNYESLEKLLLFRSEKLVLDFGVPILPDIDSS